MNEKVRMKMSLGADKPYNKKLYDKMSECWTHAKLQGRNVHLFTMFSVGIIGVGQIGGTLAHLLSSKPAFSLRLFDKNLQAIRGRVLDLAQARLLDQGHTPMEVVDTASDLKDCDLIVITAGKARQPGMDRNQLLAFNQALMVELALSLKDAKGIVIVVTNPVDIMGAQFYHTSGLEFHRVIGMAGLLDSLRLRHALQRHFGCSPHDIEGMVIGPHNDGMVPIKSSVRVQGQPLDPSFSKEAWQDIVRRTQQGGKEIVDLLGTGSAFYAPAHCLLAMIQAIAFDQRRLFSCGIQVHGHYGLDNVFLSLPIILGRKGMEEVHTFALEPEEQAALHAGAHGLQQIWGVHSASMLA